MPARSPRAPSEVGDDVVVLPSGKRSKVKSIATFDGELEVASPPLSIVMQLEDDVDVSRGDVICRPHNQPDKSSDFEAMVCWMADEPSKPGNRYTIKHTTRSSQGHRRGHALPHGREHAAARPGVD